MGVYDTVYVDEDCRRCGRRVRQSIQFKVPNSWVRTYELGDELEAPDEDLRHGLWVALGAADRCPECGADDDEDFDRAVWIEDGRVVAVAPWPDAFSYDELMEPGRGVYMRAQPGWRRGEAPG